MFSTLGTVGFLATAIRPSPTTPNLLGALLVLMSPCSSSAPSQ
jgi:hypothetical protein